MIWFLSFVIFLFFVAIIILGQKLTKFENLYKNLQVSFLDSTKNYSNLHEIYLNQIESARIKDEKYQSLVQNFNQEKLKTQDVLGKYSELERLNRINLLRIESLHKQITSEAAEKRNEIIAARADATNIQKSVIKGKISENIAPLLPCWKWNISDTRFLGGSPLDFIVYNGISNDLITDIVLVDVKTGAAQLTTRQRQIRDIIKDNKVSFETVYIDKNND